MVGCRSDHRRRGHGVGEMDRDHSRGDGLLRPMADASDVMRVPQSHHTDAVAARAPDGDLHRLEGDRLSEPALPVDGEDGSGVGDDLHIPVELEVALQQRAHVARRHADAVGVDPAVTVRPPGPRVRDGVDLGGSHDEPR